MRVARRDRRALADMNVTADQRRRSAVEWPRGERGLQLRPYQSLGLFPGFDMASAANRR